MKPARKIAFSVVGVIALLLGRYLYHHTITPLDRPFFLSGKKETIVATYVDWMCNCANFVDTAAYKAKRKPEPADHDYFFIEPAQPNFVWDRNHFLKNRYVRLTGQFYSDKGIPTDFKTGFIEDKPPHARVFRFEKIEYIDEK